MGGPNGGDFNSYVDVGPKFVSFESSNVVSGGTSFVTMTSSSDVNIAFHNPTGEAVTFNSTITAAGLGFYLANTGAGGCLYSSCNQSGGPSGLADLLTPTDGGNGSIGGVSFQFDVLSGDVSLYHLDGSLLLSRNGACDNFCVSDGLGNADVGARARLNGFRTVADDASSLGYAWDATDISFDIGAATDQILTYRTTVSSFTYAQCLDGGSSCLIALSGFGDPIGRGGGADAAVHVESLLGPFAGSGGITGVTFGPSTFQRPTFKNGVLTFSDGVPEPATWTSMILGFGLLGAALRRRRELAHA